MNFKANQLMFALFQNNGTVLVNCFVGSSRSATVVTAYLIMFRQVIRW